MLFNALTSIAPYALALLILRDIAGVNEGIQIFLVTLGLLYCGFFFLIFLSTKLVIYICMNENTLQLVYFPLVKRKYEWTNIIEIAFSLEGRNVQHIYIKMNNGTRIDYSLNFNPFTTNGEVTSSIKDNAHKHNIRVVNDLSENIH